ncbi:MAG: ribonuclease H-like domain-containing protein [Lachnospiraceae bacterium]
MLTIQKKLSHIEDSLLNIIPKNYIFFDIETTGLKKETTSLYLIGCIYFKENTWNLIQFFNEDNASEKQILEAFFSILSLDTCLIHYNGIRFDIPYINYKRKQYHLDEIGTKTCPLSVDLYCEFSKLKNILILDGKRQKDLEKFFNLSREDKRNGGELIPIYYSYIKTKDKKLLSLLLLHNEDDILGLFSLFGKFLPYHDLSDGNFSITNLRCTKNILSISFSLPQSLPKEIRRKKEGIYFHIEKDKGILSVCLCEEELKFFYPNYKEYYYLLAEDYAIHKSIAQFVDKNYRKKATAKTCYQKKESIFLPLCKTFPIKNFSDLEIFRKDYADKQTYIEYKKELSTNFWRTYVHSYYISLL